MIKRVAFVSFIVVALLGPVHAKKKVYAQGQLVDLSPLYIDALFSNIFLPAPRILLGYEFQIQVGDNTYFLNVATCCPTPGRQYKLEWAVCDQATRRQGVERAPRDAGSRNCEPIAVPASSVSPISIAA